MPTVIEYKNGELTGNRVAGFDLDDTLMCRGAVNVYPGVKDKLKKLADEGWNIVIVSNQKVRSIGDPKLLVKLEKVAKALQVPFHAYCARGEDNYRKPEIGIIDIIPESYGKMEFFVGDAAGRPGDHSDCDKEFAKNYSIPFYTPEEYFLKSSIQEHKEKEFYIPSGLLKYDTKDIPILTMIILIGFPGSGKSTYAKKFMLEYTIINRDILKTMTKCVKECNRLLSSGNNVIVDNLNGTKDTRKQFIDVAIENGARIIAIHINTPMEQSQQWNRTRENKVPKIVYYTYRKEYQEPSGDEGFDEIYTIN